MIAGVVLAVMAAAIASETNFERSIAHLPPERQAALREKRRQWHEGLQRQAEDTARHSGLDRDHALTFLLGVALGVGLA